MADVALPEPSPALSDAQAVGAALRAARVEAGLSQYDIAALLGTSQPIVCRLESGERRPSWRWLRQWAWSCDVAPSKLMRCLDAETRGHPY